MKKCSKCKVKKPLTEFSKRVLSKDGLMYSCKGCQNNRAKQYYEDNIDLKRSYSKNQYYQNIEYYREYRQEHIEKKRQYDKLYYNKNPHFRKWRDLLNQTIKRLEGDKTNSTEQLLGYNAHQLKEHLENQGMEWGIHEIDHKIPVSWFKKNTPPHIVNDLRNLEPLTKNQNQIKGNKSASPVDKEYAEKALIFLKRKYVDYVVIQDIVRIFTG